MALRGKLYNCSRHENNKGVLTSLDQCPAITDWPTQFVCPTVPSCRCFIYLDPAAQLWTHMHKGAHICWHPSCTRMERSSERMQEPQHHRLLFHRTHLLLIPNAVVDPHPLTLALRCSHWPIGEGSLYMDIGS